MIDFVKDAQWTNAEAGDRITDYHALGYHGVQCGDARWGINKQGVMAVLSADTSHELTPVMAYFADHWSRIDYAVTVIDRDDVFNPSEQYFWQWREKHPEGKGPLNVTRIQSTRGGSTLFLGSRGSARYTRVYNKHVESDGQYPPGSWRFELELKREQSEQAHASWKEHLHGITYIQGMAVSQLEEHGFPIPFDPLEHPTHRGVPAKVRDVDRTLKWLETQVAPSIDWVKEAVGNEEVKRILGL
jgi:DNA relaxase NicK